MATTSPVGMVRGQGLAGVGRLVADQLMPRKAAGIQLATANRCRIAPVRALRAPSRQDAAPEHQPAASPPMMPWSMALLHRGGEERLADHPHDPEQVAGEQSAPLEPADPPRNRSGLAGRGCRGRRTGGSGMAQPRYRPGDPRAKPIYRCPGGDGRCLHVRGWPTAVCLHGIRDRHP